MQPVAVHATGGHRLSCGYTIPVEIRVLGRDKRVSELDNRILERGDFQSSIGVIYVWGLMQDFAAVLDSETKN